MTENYIYCDGSTMNNGNGTKIKRSGVGAVLMLGGERHIISRAVDADHNHRVEVKAAALAMIRALILAPEIATQPVTLYTDSEYFSDRFNYIVAQTAPDPLWHTVREIAAMFSGLIVKVVARSPWANTNIHAEADKLAKIGAGMYGSQYPKPKKPLKSTAMEFSFMVHLPSDRVGKTIPVRANSMRHAIALVSAGIPNEACCVEIKRTK